MNIRIRSGEKQEAINIMREAAQWLIGIGKPLWDLNDLHVDSFSNPPDEFYVMWNENESVASMVLSFEDKFIWPDIAPNTSGFIHKLSVKRKYAGKGYSKTMVDHAKMICTNKGINYSTCTIGIGGDHKPLFIASLPWNYRAFHVDHMRLFVGLWSPL